MAQPKRPVATELARAFVSHRTQKAAAESLGVSESRYGEWIREPEVQKLISQHNDDRYKRAVTKLGHLSYLALDRLEELLNDRKINPQVVNNLIRTALEYNSKFYETTELQRRLEELEKRLELTEG